MASPVRWHELGQTLGDGEGQGSLMDCSPRGRKEADTTGQQQQQHQQPHHALHYSTSVSARTLSQFVRIDYFLMSVRQCVRAACCVCSVMSDSWWPYGLWSARLPCLWNFPGKCTGVGCHFVVQGVLLTQRSNLQSLVSPALAGGFFPTSNTWEAPILL